MQETPLGWVLPHFLQLGELALPLEVDWPRSQHFLQLRGLGVEG